MTAASITIVGNLTDDPELRFTPQGKPVANFTIACSKAAKNEAGDWVNTNESFWRCVAWDQMAENIAESLTKGAAVIAQGTVVQKSYEAKDGSGKRSYMEITVWAIGPDLKKATAKVTKASRAVADGKGGPVDDPWSSPAAFDEPPF